MSTEPIGRDEARELARRELEKQIYHRDDPSLLERIWDRFSDWLDDLLRQADGGSGSSGGGRLSIVVIVVLVAVAVGLVLWLMRDRRNPRSNRAPLLEEQPSTAQDHRSAADAMAAAGQWAEAIRERLRAIARDLEERAILGPRPGRTADELAAEAGVALPGYADRLDGAVKIFDDVWYGDRPGTAAGYATLRDLDEELRTAKPRPVEPAAPVEQAGAPS